MRHLTATCAPTQDDGNEQDGTVTYNPITGMFDIYMDGIKIDETASRVDGAIALRDWQMWFDACQAVN
jgi:hypothetical protein